MKKIMLVCNAGMSTGMLAKKIEAASDHTLEVSAYSESEYQDFVEAISPMKYGIMDGKGVYEDIKKLIGG